MQSEQKSAVRLVLDTNVFVSGLVWQGATARLIDLVIKGDLHVDLASSPALLAEFCDVVNRQKFVRRLRAISRTPDDLIGEYTSMVKMYSPAPVPRTVRDDPDDDDVLAAAVAASAHLIVTGDMHLLKLQRFRQVPIVRTAFAIGVLAGPKTRQTGQPLPKGESFPAACDEFNTPAAR